ncbi:hypothetical protein SUNI508_06890 [Seiridium unicorne]|uniref:Clr5 domain-containing protein n=1 Tax=Seiridium unicorne TaxID=138068 RepID=A0ABR2UYX0_9PEZI
MSELPTPISQFDWECQKDKFIDLYHRRKLPLQDKHGGPSVTQIMREEHNFTASVSQYEAQIKRWDVPKNLKRHEWTQIIAKMDVLKSRGVETRLKLAGSLVSADKIKQNRRRYLREGPITPNAAGSRPDQFLWDSPRFTLEILATNGEWSSYRGGETPGRTSLWPAPLEFDFAALEPDCLPHELHIGNSFAIDRAEHGIEASVLDSQSTSMHSHGNLGTSVLQTRVELGMTYVQASEEVIGMREVAGDGGGLLPSDSSVIPMAPPSSVIDTEPGTMNAGSIASVNTTSCHPMDLTIDDVEIQRPVSVTPSNHPVPHPYFRDDTGAIEIACDPEYLATGLDLNQNTTSTLYRRNGLPDLPDNRSTKLSNGLATDRSLAFSPAWQGFSPPAMDLAERPPSRPGQQLSSFLRDDSVDMSLSKWLEKSPFFLLEAHMQNMSMRSAGRAEENSSMFELSHDNASLPTEPTETQYGMNSMFVLQEISGIANTAQMIAACLGQKQLTQDHRFNKFTDRLGSLLPESMYALSGNTIAPGVSVFGMSRILESPFHRAILYSTVNGFAGCSGLPAPSLLQIYSSISRYTRSCPSVAVRSLVDNIFSASVVSRSAQAADALLKMTVGTPYAIDVNKVITAEDCAPSTPIEMALRVPDLETAEVLLRAGVDPTRALSILMRRRDCPDSSRLKFIRQLLDKGAKPKVMIIERLWGHADETLMELLLSRIPRTSYRMYFEDPQSPHINDVGILANTAWYLRNNAATRIIKRVLCEWPRAETEMMFTRTYEHTMDYTLIHACAKGNIELAKFLLPFVSQISAAALVAAVRTRQQPLIELLLESGANVSDLPKYESWIPRRPCHCQKSNFQSNLLDGELFTPLAEAIRSGNQQLAHKLEYTLTRADSTSLRQALEAAADVGDLEYFQVILYRASRTKGDHLRRALCLAIDQNRDDLAFMLLDAGAEVNGPQKHPRRYSKDIPLIVAMRAHRKKLVEAMLQHEVRLHGDHYIMAAASWGDVDIVKSLLSSQAVVSTRALRTALRAGDENMLNMLLDHFWRYDDRFQSWNGEYGTQNEENYGDDELVKLVKSAFCSKNDTLLISFLEHGAKVGRRALGAAIRRKDTAILDRLLAYATRHGEVLDEVVKSRNQSLLRQWLSEGANLVREGAFLHAMQFDKPSYHILMEAFKARYPQGLKGWGGVLLKNAIRKDNSPLLKALLAAKVDVNSFGGKRFYGRASYSPLGFVICLKKGTNLEDVELLLDAGSNPNGIARSDLPDMSGWKTPLLLAIETGNLKLVQLLLRRGADVNLAARCRRKRATALQLAAISGSIKIFKLLLRNCADIRARPAKVYGRTPFEGAAEHGRLDMLKVIWDATFPEGIGKQEASNAIHFSRMNGHQGCEQYIRYLVPAADIIELSDDQKERKWRHRPYTEPPRYSILARGKKLGDESDTEYDTESDEDASDEIMEDSDWDD